MSDGPLTENSAFTAAMTALRSRFFTVLSDADFAALESLAVRASDPAGAMQRLERWLERVEPAAARDAIRQGESWLADAVAVFGHCQHHADWLIAHETETAALARDCFDAAPTGRVRLREELMSRVAAGGEDEVLAALRHVNYRETLRIARLDLVHGLEPRRVTLALSDLADAMLDAALRAAVRLTVPDDVFPGIDPTLGIAVIALGKLGSRELNYSSDIDVMFVHEDEFRVARPDGRDYEISRGVLAAVISKAMHLLEERTAGGFCYRVDMRLRPDGAGGPLTRTVAGAAQYYRERGRVWERQMLLRFRSAAGATVLGDLLYAAVEPFIFQSRLDIDAIQEIKDLKRKIEAGAEHKGVRFREIKTGFGGIRDIEFAVQFLQLLHGVEHKPLRAGSTWDGLAALYPLRVLERRDQVALLDAWNFLRRLEHRLQLRHNLQTHLMPEEPAELDVIGRSMGYRRDAGGALRQALQRHARETRKTLDRVLHRAFQSRHEAPTVEWLLGVADNAEAIQAALEQAGFDDAEQARVRLRAMAEERSPIAASSPLVRRNFASIAPRILRRLRETTYPDEALAVLEQCVASLGGKAMLYQQFADIPQTLDIFLDLAMWSRPLAGIIIREPGILDQVMDSLMVGRVKTLPALREELDVLLPGFETLAGALHAFKNQEVLRIGIRDLQNKSDTPAILGELSDLAETVAVAAARVEQHRLQPPGAYAMLALGKLGGREMSYQSDLDMILFCDAPESAREQWLEWAQSLLAVLAEGDAGGAVYSLDLRLRPQGTAGPLVTTRDAFLRYHQPNGGAQFWEKQFLLKSRVIAGDPGLAAALERDLDGLLRLLEPREQIFAEVRAMRARIEAEYPAHFKKGRGGIVDIEFLAQALQLAALAAGGEARAAHTLQALEALRGIGELTAGEAETLREHWIFLRRVETRLQIATDLGSDALPAPGAAADQMAARLGMTGPNAGTELSRRLDAVMQDNRRLFETILAR